MITPIEYKQLVETKGIRLFGHTEIALSREDAVNAIKLLEGTEVSILGGDVYFKNGEQIVLAYANWHSDQRSGENRQEFIVRSHAEALSYIEKFPAHDSEVLFALTTN